MPSVDLPVLAIREANEHLQALFLENQKLDTQTHELNATLKQTEEENARLNEYVKSVNDRILKLGQEHIENLNALRESLNAENSRRMADLQKSHEKKMVLEVERMKAEESAKIEELHEKWKMEEGKRISDLEDRLKNEEKNRITDLQVKLKSEEKKKVNQLQKTIDELEDKIQKLNEYAVNNTKHREENIVLLNNMFKSTIENMSQCLNITGDEEFARSDISMQQEDGSVSLDGSDDSAYSSKLVSSLSDVSDVPSDGPMMSSSDLENSSHVLLNGDVHDDCVT